MIRQSRISNMCILFFYKFVKIDIYDYNIVISTNFACQKLTPFGCIKKLKTKNFLLSFCRLARSIFDFYGDDIFPLVLVFPVSCK